MLERYTSAHHSQAFDFIFKSIYGLMGHQIFMECILVHTVHSLFQKKGLLVQNFVISSEGD